MNPGTSSSNGEGASSLADAPLPHTGDAGEEDGVKGAAIEVESTKKAEGKDSVMVDINLVDTIPDCSEHKVDALQKSNGAGLGPCAFLIPRCIRYNRENHPPEATGLALDAYARGAVTMSFMFLGPGLLLLASQAAGCANIKSQCEAKVYGMKPSSLLSNMAVVAGVFGGLLMPLLGAVVDHTPHRRAVGAWSGALLAGINGFQIFLNQHTWAAVAILQVIGGVVYLAHSNAQYAYTSELTDSVPMLASYNGTFNAVYYASMVFFLVVVMAIATILATGDVATAIISQAVAFTTALVFFGYAWRYLFRRKPAKSHVPEGSSLISCGFLKVLSTSQTIWGKYPALVWFYASALCSESAGSAFTSIATTFMTLFLGMNAREIGLAFLVVLLAGIPGSKLAGYLSTRFDPIRSIQGCLIFWIVVTCGAVAVLTGPERKSYLLPFGACWGLSLGWLYPAHTTLLCTIMPRGQESELMGLYLFSGQVLSWLPPLIFSFLIEAGFNMDIGLASLVFFLVLALGLISMIGPHAAAMRRANTACHDASGSDGVALTGNSSLEHSAVELTMLSGQIN